MERNYVTVTLLYKQKEGSLRFSLIFLSVSCVRNVGAIISQCYLSDNGSICWLGPDSAPGVSARCDVMVGIITF